MPVVYDLLNSCIRRTLDNDFLFTFSKPFAVSYYSHVNDMDLHSGIIFHVLFLVLLLRMTNFSCVFS